MPLSFIMLSSVTKLFITFKIFIILPYKQIWSYFEDWVMNKNDLRENMEMDIASFGLIAAISTAEDCKDEDFANVIKILDEDGTEVNITTDKFVELFDTHGLSGIIL